MASKPKWSTPDRQAYLVKLWYAIGDRCLLGHSLCPEVSHYLYAEYRLGYKPKAFKRGMKDSWTDSVKRDNEGKPIYYWDYKPELVSIAETKVARLYEYLSEQAIKAWKYDDRLQRQVELKAWQKAIHRITSRNKPRCDFNADAFYDAQPIYYLEGLGISGLTFKPFAKVRLSSSYTCLLVELDSQIFRPLSKNKKRKALRYGKGLPEVIDQIIRSKCWLAVKHYLKW